MSTAKSNSGFWRSVRSWPDRTPLRVKLIAAVLALVAVALTIISIATLFGLRGYLLSPTDTVLTGSGKFQSNQLVANFLDGGGPANAAGQEVVWISASGQSRQVVQPTTEPVIDYHNFQSPRTSPEPGFSLPSTSASWLAANSGHPLTLPATSGSGRWRVLISHTTYSETNGGTISGYIVNGVNVTTVYSTVGELALIELIVSCAALAGLALVGVMLVRATLRPLSDIERTAGAIASGDLSRRVPERGPRTEVGSLGRSLNVMLGRIEQAFSAQQHSEAAARRSEARMRQFVADASHELRTPLTAIRGFAEYYRQRGGVAVGESPAQANVAQGSSAQPDDAQAAVAPADAAQADPARAATAVTQPVTGVAGNGSSKLAAPELDRIMRRVEQESARMGVLVEDMLLLARLDQQRPLQRTTVDLLALAADAVHDARVMAPDRNINLSVSSGAAPLVLGDEVRIRQVIGNLMSNALTHTPDGTPVDVHLRPGRLAEASSAVGWEIPDEPVAVLEVTDHGQGMTAEQAGHAFERFYRADISRTSAGSGLGLAIVAALVSAHGGAVWVDSQPGKGATFLIALPLAPEAVDGADDEDEAAQDGESDSADTQATTSTQAARGQKPGAPTS
jgi:two-component system, OmpR family, sensor kinase